MAWGWVRRAVVCPTCQSNFHLGLKARHSGLQSLTWRGPSPKRARSGLVRKCWCYARTVSVAGDGILANVYLASWLDFLDVCAMWATDYPKSTMYAELREGHNATVDRWCDLLQQVAAARMEDTDVVQLGGEGRVVEIDESVLNKKKRTHMNVAPRPTTRWLWGAVEEDNHDRFTFKILNHPD